MENDNKKIVTLVAVFSGAVFALVLEILLESLAASFSWIVQMRSNDTAKHGLPILAGFAVFAVLQFHPKIKVWLEEVISEIRKIVWPSQKDVTAMTIVCCVMVVVAGIGFGLFDYLSSQLIKVFVN